MTVLERTVLLIVAGAFAGGLAWGASNLIDARQSCSVLDVRLKELESTKVVPAQLDDVKHEIAALRADLERWRAEDGNRQHR